MTSLDKVLTTGFCILWAIFIFIDYWFYHPEYAVAIQYFQYVDTILLLGGLGAGIYWANKKWKNHRVGKLLQGGLGIYLVILLISTIIIWTHYHKVSEEFLGFEGFVFLGKITGILAVSYLIFGFCYLLGDLIMSQFFSVQLPSLDTKVVNIAVGISIFSLFLMILGAFSLLNSYLILGLIVGLMMTRWKVTLVFFKATIITPLDKGNHLNWIGFSSLFILLVFISLNIINNTRPLPFGFDALAIYLNLPQMIGSQGSLIEGYSPYYWSLFTSLGYLIFDQTSIAIAIASGGGILSLFSLYAISKKWLNINWSMVVILFFYSLPIINYQSYLDIKTDLGLLFILLTAFLLLIHWLNKKDLSLFKSQTMLNQADKSEEESSSKKPILETILPDSDQLIIILGILSGMALGTKLTALIFVLGILSVFSFIKGGKIGLLANFALTIAIVLIANLDTSLRAYHFNTEWLQWLCLLVGLLGLAYLAIKQRTKFIQLVKVTSIYLCFVGLLYIPWPIKNYKEVGVISFKTFIEGKPIGIPTKGK